MKPTVCRCCGEHFTSPFQQELDNPNICPSCASLVQDVQDNMIIETAIPHETEPADKPESKPGPTQPSPQTVTKDQQK